MTAEAVLALLDRLSAAGVDGWVDGGWGIDALLGEQTRPHDDLDLVIPDSHLAVVVDLLQRDGFDIERQLLPTAIAFRHADGRGVDLHLVEPTADGGGDQLLEDAFRWHYDPPVVGTIGGRAVRCCSVETQVAAHLGYEPDAQDRADLHALATRFGLTLPPPYTE